jgi:hypothetical protein
MFLDIVVDAVHDVTTATKEVGDFEKDEEWGQDEGLDEGFKERRSLSLEPFVAGELGNPGEEEEADGEFVGGCLGLAIDKLAELDGAVKKDGDCGEAEFDVQQCVIDAVADCREHCWIEVNIIAIMVIGPQKEGREEDHWHAHNVDEHIGPIAMMFAVERKLFLQVDSSHIDADVKKKRGP